MGLTAMGYIKAAQGLSERAEAALSSDALVVTTAIDDWNTRYLASLETVARLPALARMLSSEYETMLAEDEETARESLVALAAPGEDVESVAIVDMADTVLLSSRPGPGISVRQASPGGRVGRLDCRNVDSLD